MAKFPLTILSFPLLPAHCPQHNVPGGAVVVVVEEVVVVVVGGVVVHSPLATQSRPVPVLLELGDPKIPMKILMSVLSTSLLRKVLLCGVLPVLKTTVLRRFMLLDWKTQQTSPLSGDGTRTEETISTQRTLGRPRYRQTAL